MEDIKEEKQEKRHVSYSQYSTWLKCPHKFYLDKVLDKKKFEDSVNTCFGTAMHEVIQKYIETLYTQNAQVADSIDFKKLFVERFDFEIDDKMKKAGKEVSDDEYTEFVYDGHGILDTFCTPTNRLTNFPSKKYELVGIEFPLDLPLIHNVNFTAYIDLILKDKQTGKYKIYDFKTSSSGWNQYMKQDETKYSQILLYKALYSKQFNVPLHMVDVEFFILKRKLYENVNFPQSKIQKFIPENGNGPIVSTLNGFSEFIKSCFNEDGTYKNDATLYPKTPGDRKKNCKYCPHKKVDCDAKATVQDDNDT